MTFDFHKHPADHPTIDEAREGGDKLHQSGRLPLAVDGNYAFPTCVRCPTTLGNQGQGQDRPRKGKAKTGYLPVRQVLQSDSGSEDGYAFIAMIQLRPPLQIDYRAINEHCCNDTRNGDLSKTQSANGDKLRFSALASTCQASSCLADDDLSGSQLYPGMPTSLPQIFDDDLAAIALLKLPVTSGPAHRERIRQGHCLGTQSDSD